MKLATFIAILPALVSSPVPQAASQRTSSWTCGADISFLQQIEDSGGIYWADGISQDALQILADHGVNSIRLRLWHTPPEGYNNLEKTLEMADRIDQMGLKFLLDFHYSDTWADPGKQYKPAAWESLPLPSLKDSVYQYTRDVISSLKNQSTLPDIVQIGNEITNGLLWDEGRVGGSYDTPQQWGQFAQLVAAGISGVRDALEPGDSVRIMIHIDRGADNAGCRWFFDNLMAQGVNFDLIGLSYYPWWHGQMSQVSANLNDLALRYDKDIILVETAYPWTLGWADTVHNMVGDSSQLHPGYEASPEGQQAFLEDLRAVVWNTPLGRGQGVYYWTPEWISTPTLGSAWENLTLFDFDGQLLSSIHAFDQVSCRPTLDGIPDSCYGPPRASDSRTDGGGNDQMDLLDLYVCHDATYWYFCFTIDDRIAWPDVWGKYIIYLDTDGLIGSGAADDAWGRAVQATDQHLPEYGLYSWVNDYPYHVGHTQLWAYSDSGWAMIGTLLGAAQSIADTSGLEWMVRASAIGSPESLWCEVWSTGGGGSDNARDTSNDPPDDWNGFPGDWSTLAVIHVSTLVHASARCDAEPPEAIDDLQAFLEGISKAGSGHVHLIWSEPEDDVAATVYIVYRSTVVDSGGDSLAVTEDTAHVDSAAVGTMGTNYFYTVRAMDASGHISNPSNRVGEFDVHLRRTK